MGGHLSALSSGITFTRVWEDHAVDRRALAIAPGSRLLVIASAGDTALDAIALGADEVVAVDRNPAQLHLVELKVAAITALDWPAIWRLFAAGRLHGARSVYAASLRSRLSESARRYWDRRIGIFELGLHGHGWLGFGMELMRLAIRLQAGPGAINSIVASPDLSSQARLWGNRLRPRLIDRAASRSVVLPALIHLLTMNQKQRSLLVADAYPMAMLSRIDSLMQSARVAQNPYWHLALTGLPSAADDECDWLRPGVLPRLRRSIAAVSLSRGDVVDALRARPRLSLDAIHLSDVPDWMDRRHHIRLLDAAADALRPGGRLLVRSASTRPPLPDDDRFDLDPASLELTASERTALYGSVQLLRRRPVLGHVGDGPRLDEARRPPTSRIL